MMNISGTDTSCYTNLSPGLSLQMYSMTADQDHHDDHHDVADDHHVSSNSHLQPNNSTTSSLLYSLSILKDKVHQLQSLVAILLSPAADSSASIAIAGMNMHSAIQEIIMTASSMLLNFQHMGLASTSGNPSSTTPHDNNNNNNNITNIPHPNIGNTLSSSSSLGQSLIYPSTDHHQTVLDWYGSSHGDDQNYNNSKITCTTSSIKENKYNSSNQIMTHCSNKANIGEENVFPLALGSETKDGQGVISAPNSYDIIELDAADLLAKYTHYCQVCGKGFKRDANLRMHMRAHGDEYKTSSALSNPIKRMNTDLMGINRDFPTRLAKKYSCPQEGCRWNQRHAKFQPLKSMICVKNHYKRSHCPKMYVCKKCNGKQFSVLSDLRTHEKHCGDLKWQCSCGTTFSRKDKLMGHVSLFVGHTPMLMNNGTSSTYNNNKPTKVESQLVSEVQIESIVKMME